MDENPDIALDNLTPWNFMKFILLGIISMALVGCQSGPAGQAVTNYGNGVEIPESARPNEATKQAYILRQASWFGDQIRRGRVYIVRPAGNAVPFNTEPNTPSKKLEKEFQVGSLISYLYYDDGVVRYDGTPAAVRFKRSPDNDTYFFTHSTGKSITSYILGHAICMGHIESINEPVDWPQLSATLYQGQPVIDLLNMSAGDAHLVDDAATRWKGHPTHHRSIPLYQVAKILDGTEKRGTGVFYNNTLTDLIAGYIELKAGDEYDVLMEHVFQDKAKIEKPVYYERQSRASYSYFITRMDLLRIAVAMMNDYQAGNCVGQYLQDLQSQEKIWPKYGTSGKRSVNLMNHSRHYGGQFYWSFDGMRNRNILGADGLNGQNILIDLDNSRIVATHAISSGWDTGGLMVKVIKKGKLPN